MNQVLSVLSSLVDSDHLGGWTRAIVAAAGGFLVAHYGMQYWNGDVVISGIGTVASAMVVGLWSSLAKTVASKSTATP